MKRKSFLAFFGFRKGCHQERVWNDCVGSALPVYQKTSPCERVFELRQSPKESFGPHPAILDGASSIHHDLAFQEGTRSDNRVFADLDVIPDPAWRDELRQR